jgi:transcription elongation GreA/GreB family factor
VFLTLDTLRYDVAAQSLAGGRTPNMASVLPNQRWERWPSPGSITYSAHHAFFAGFLPTLEQPGRVERLFATEFPGSLTTGPKTCVFGEASSSLDSAIRGDVVVNKKAIVHAFRQHLQSRLDTLRRGGAVAREGTRVDGSHRPTNSRLTPGPPGSVGRDFSTGNLCFESASVALRPRIRGERAAVTSQGYLAFGLAQRAKELEDALVLLEKVGWGSRDKVVMGALVMVRTEDDSLERYILLPGGQGDRFGDVVVVSPTAPVARELAGLSDGDEATFQRGGHLIEVEIESVE